MKLTLKELMALTEAYFVTNGDLVCFQEGRHIVLGTQVPSTGHFTMSDEGAAFVHRLNGDAAEPVDHVAETVAAMAKDPAEIDVEVPDVVVEPKDEDQVIEVTDEHQATSEATLAALLAD